MTPAIPSETPIASGLDRVPPGVTIGVGGITGGGMGGGFCTFTFGLHISIAQSIVFVLFSMVFD